MEDDWRVGAIRQYLEDAKNKPGDSVCVVELWHKALGQDEFIKPTRKDSIEITQIMYRMDGWIRGENPARTPWGLQRVFRKDKPFWMS